MSAPSTAPTSPLETWFTGAAGITLVVALLKYGNPVVLGVRPDWLEAPGLGRQGGDLLESVLGPWPLLWGYLGMALLILLAVLLQFNRERPARLSWWVALPLVWGLWQWVASFRTIEPRLTTPALRQFLCCLIWFYLGVFGLSAVRRPGLFLGILSAGFGWVMAIGWYQHFIGLEETRRYFYELPNWKQFPPAFLAKLSSERIYSTLFYPNALAGVILLLAPLILTWTWQWTVRWERGARVLMTALVGIATAGALYWSQSKAGWLILLGLGGVYFADWPIARRWKVIVLGTALVIGLAGFFWRYSDYFSRGATSLTARFDYWRAALQVARDHPILGTGPGTFMVNYSRLRPSGAEMARLTHNDYLQQACDSGWPGAVAYIVLMGGSLISLHRRRSLRASPLFFAAWLGLLGYALQSTMEFGLYIPALSWPAFFLFGWLLSQGQSDRLPAHESPVS